MARQFREQLEEEVQLEEARKAQRAAPPPDPEPPVKEPPPRDPPVSEPPEVPPEPRPPTHPTDETGADPRAARAEAQIVPDERGT